MPGWGDGPAQKEEGRRKSDVNVSGYRSSGGGGGRDIVFNAVVDPQLWTIERLG